ncbi:MAG TPA: thiamine pyrophosphate-dependent enzyme [Solirubrobacteraceae bacterium]|jgi:indolepyruvate decarboxylase
MTSAPEPATTVASYLAQRLSDIGVGHLFAVPGDYAGPFLSAVDVAGAPVRIGTPSELVAGYAADGYTRLNGVGAACVTFGVGAFSLLNAIAGCYVEMLPVVVVNGSPSTANRQQERVEGVLFHHSTGDLRSNLEAFARVTVHQEVVSDPAAAPAQIDAALTACLGTRRPVYLEVEKDAWARACAAPSGPILPAPLPCVGAAVEQAAAEVVARLRGAQRPLLWYGVEVKRRGLGKAVERLVEAVGLPFACDLMGKATVNEDHPRYLGVFDGAPALTRVADAVKASDCVLALGTLVTDDFLDLVGDAYGTMVLAWDGRVRIGYHAYDDVPLEPFLAELERQLTGARVRAPDEAADELRSALAPLRAVGAPPSDALTYESFFARIAQFVDDSTVLVADTSNSLYLAGDVRVATDGFVAQSAWGSIGHTVGAAVGVGFGAPSRRAVVVVGDGGFQMDCQALSTLAEHRQAAIVCVMSNGLYGIEQALVNLGFYTKGEAPEAFNLLPRWDYVKLAEAFGGAGFVASTLGELDAALAAARAQTGTFSLIEVRVPERDLPDNIRRLAEDPG